MRDMCDGMGYDASAENYVTARISPAYLSTLNLSDPRVIELYLALYY